MLVVQPSFAHAKGRACLPERLLVAYAGVVVPAKRNVEPAALVHSIQAIKARLVEHDKPSRPFNRVLDLSGVHEVTLESSEIHDYARSRTGAAASLPSFRTAIIAPHNEVLSLALLYATLMENSQIEVRLFENPASAAAWLEVPVSAVSGPVVAPERPGISHIGEHRPA